VPNPVIADKVYPAFLRGEYDTAVFQAFREVEVAVRDGGKFQADAVGVKLMRDAFRPAQGANPSGPLSDSALPVAEQEGMMNLFAGAIALYKNPLRELSFRPPFERITDPQIPPTRPFF
jgi:uncharacterized protein (TIGR02391 family)